MTCKKLNKIDVFSEAAKMFIEKIEYTVEDLKNDLVKRVPIPTLTSNITSQLLISSIKKLCSQLASYDISRETNQKKKEKVLLSLKKLKDAISHIIEK